MLDATNQNFVGLFKDAFKRCFGVNLYTTLSETECKHFSNQIFEETGLVIGAKSLKNYSSYILNPLEAKKEKPSVATLDTLARYVLNAPYTDEIKRKEKEPHYPYWFQYRNSVTIEKENAQYTSELSNIYPKNKKWIAPFIAIFIISSGLLVFYFLSPKANKKFTDDFHAVNEDALKNNGWFLKSEDKIWWGRRSEMPSHLTLFTLPGDNWTDSAHIPNIKNLLLRKATSDCFIAEVHLDDFVPMRKWQQAGILLLEDTNFYAKSLRLSLAYNDFFGGYNKPKEIIVQAIYSSGNEVKNPEEIIHFPVSSIETGQEVLVATNLQKSALRIEKKGEHYRFLYATGQAENFAFKEILNKDIPLQPRYIGIFALDGFVNDPNYLPARFKYFSLIDNACTK